jgi:hypothetical protein
MAARKNRVLVSDSDDNGTDGTYVAPESERKRPRDEDTTSPPPPKRARLLSDVLKYGECFRCERHAFLVPMPFLEYCHLCLSCTADDKDDKDIAEIKRRRHQRHIDERAGRVVDRKMRRDKGEADVSDASLDYSSD